MRTWKKATVLGVLLLLLIGGGALIYDQTASRTHRAPAVRSQHRPAEGGATAVGNTEPGEPLHRDARSSLPPPVDLTQADLDRDVHGVVVDQDDKPIAGAALDLVTYQWRRTSTLNMKDRDQEQVGPSTVSAVDGTYSMRARRGRLANLRVRAPGYAEVELRQVQAGERVRVKLFPGVSVVILTVDESGQPVADVTVKLFSRTASRGEPRQLTVTQVTGANGRALFESLPVQLKVYVESVPVELGSAGWIYYETPASGRDELKVTLPRGRTITGRVIDAKTNQPLAGARVGMGWTLFRETTTDVDGRYEIRGWNPKGGRQEIAVDADGYGQTSKIVEGRETIDFKLVAGGGVTGRIVDQNGNPAADVLVGAIGSKSSPFGPQKTSRRYTVSAEDGTFRLDGLHTDLVHTLVLQRAGLGRTVLDFTPANPQQGPLDLGEIVMAPGRAIEGTLIDRVGNPVARTEVRLANVPADGSGGLRIYYGNDERRQTDHLGRFRFPYQSAGKFTLDVSRKGDVRIEKSIVLTADKDLLDVELRLAEGREFLVWVHDETGDPVPDAVIGLTHRGGRAQNKTDDEGKARFTVLGVIQTIGAPWVLPTRKQGQQRPAYVKAKPIESVPETQNEARFILGIGGLASGILIGPDGKPLASALIEVRSEGQANRIIGVGPDARFSIAVPAGETVDIVFKQVSNAASRATPDANMYQGKLMGVRGGDTGLELRVTKPTTGRTLVVRVEGPDGDPLEGVNVFASPAPRTTKSRGRTDAEGRVELGDLPAQKVTVNVGFRRGQQEGLVPPTPLELIPNGQEVVLRFTKGVLLRGVLLQVDGQPASGGQIIVRMGKRFLAVVRTDSKGRFTVYLPTDPPEEIRIQGSHRQIGGGTLFAPDVKVDGSADPVRLQLQEKK